MFVQRPSGCHLNYVTYTLNSYISHVCRLVNFKTQIEHPLYLVKNSRFVLGGIKHQEKYRQPFKNFYQVNHLYYKNYQIISPLVLFTIHLLCIHTILKLRFINLFLDCIFTCQNEKRRMVILDFKNTTIFLKLFKN